MSEISDTHEEEKKMTLDELIAKHRDSYVDLFTSKVMDAIEELERNVGSLPEKTLNTFNAAVIEVQNAAI